MKEFKVGQNVTMSVKGAGVTSKEEHEIDDIVDGVITLVDSEKEFDLNGKWLGKDDLFGFKFSIE